MPKPRPSPGTPTPRGKAPRRKALNRSKESQEAQSKGGASKIPDSPADVGETHGSIRTVNELLPYRDQFRKAGLAVTSKEQRAYHRRGKLAPLLGKMSPPGSEWLRLDGGTETKELNNNTSKKDDSPSPINVEQISQKSGKDKLSDPSLSPPPNSTATPEAVFANPEASSPERRPPSIPDEEKKGNTQPITTPPPAPKPAGIPNSDKSLPALPRVFSQVLVRHGSGPSRNSSWSAAMRQFPPTIVEQKEPSPDKQQQQKVINHGRQQNTTTTTTTPSIQSTATTTSYGTAIIIQPAAKSYGQLLIRNTKRNSVSEATVITKTPHPSVVSSIEVPESVRTGTLSCLDQALDEAVRRMQAMGESVATSTPSGTIKSLSKSKSKPNKATGEHQRSTSSKDAPSPSQRLQKAAALRRQKMVLSGTCAVGGKGSHSPRSKPPSLASTVEREEEQVGGTTTASPTPEVEEAMAVVIPRVPSSRPPPPSSSGPSVLASIEVVHRYGLLALNRVMVLFLIPLRFLPAHSHLLSRRVNLVGETPVKLIRDRHNGFGLASGVALSPTSVSLLKVPCLNVHLIVPPLNEQAPTSVSLLNVPCLNAHLNDPPPSIPLLSVLLIVFLLIVPQSHPPAPPHSCTISSPPTHRHLPAIDILKGLQIMCAASADEELDAWFRHKTGLPLRRFLVDLRGFEDVL
ncbi:hypothetical protein NCU16311 [Neurospora crassa OR74A]|uniref:Uncharacterized protein n=1 Tax=Neurospora crassa (strain ATCC 24698 / 74-OR23-1A / CBS 708.71 / DSM 1257 / FGSC 987) TaxID=367110 RepID=V5IQE5_NEUCR|nr:hypothetical protein NCU16311 [Neurospora crassa OR74A]ESA43759.1 hypothetical protein NCU16311 [Neurospora crassa OR74A]|eukprot:XP_011393329.1 hypothetical protein NCU16311 [Neurospora crassa OR74A]